MLKRTMRKVIQTAKKWISDDPGQGANPANEMLAYPWLNSIFEKLMAQGQGTLRSNYTWGALQGVYLAKSIGIERVSMLEFGVAGGNGLVALDQVAGMLEQEFGVGVDVYGFDTGKGLPKPTDYRDLPNLWSESDFPMDEAKLRSRLQRANLLLGLVKDTLPTFIASNPAPVAFISVDVDLYSSTMEAFQLLDADPSLLMPRIHCYFDDILGFTYGDHNGERLAIAEFNASHPLRKISPIYGLKYFVPWSQHHASWVEAFYMIHILDHPLYDKRDGLLRQGQLDLQE